MINLNFVTLENGYNYMIIQEVIYQNTKYLYLVNENNSSDFCIRKIIIEDDQEKISTLESEEEFYSVIKLFNK